MRKHLVGFLAVALFLCALSNLGFTQAKRPKPRLRPTQAAEVAVREFMKKLDRWKQVQMPFQSEGLSPREIQLVNKLVDACHDIESIYWRQSDPGGLALYESLKDSKSAHDQDVRRLLWINGSRFDLLDNDRPFVEAPPIAAAHALYPPDLTRAQIEAYVQAHPAKKDAIYDPNTVVRREGQELFGVPYHIVYEPFLKDAAQKLLEAAELSDDPQFAEFLRLRSQALLSDNYYPSDLAWLDLKNPKIDLIFAPYETYLDGVLGVKTSYDAAVLVRNEKESKRLELYQKYVPDIQEALPLAKQDLPSKRGLATPMEVADAPFRAGDLDHGYQAVADTLPNDPRIHAQKGSKKIFFKNFMDARVNHLVLPLAQRIMRRDQAAKVSAEGYMAVVILHEISHGLGPLFAHAHGKQVDIQESIGPLHAALEEAKADVVGMYGLKWLVDKGALPKERLEGYYVSYLAGILRTVRFGIAEAHGRGEIMEFNYLAERKAIIRESVEGQYVYTVDFARMPDALASLSKELLEIEATGDRARAEHWFKKYDRTPVELRSALAMADSVPVDIEPVFSFPQTVK